MFAQKSAKRIVRSVEKVKGETIIFYILFYSHRANLILLAENNPLQVRNRQYEGRILP